MLRQASIALMQCFTLNLKLHVAMAVRNYITAGRCTFRTGALGRCAYLHKVQYRT